MRYLVTGAAGFVGSHLSEALRTQGHEVVGLDCFTDYYDVALKEENARALPIEVRRLDLARDRIELGGVDGVFHLAGQPGVRSFGDVFEVYLRRNLLASQRLFEAAGQPKEFWFEPAVGHGKFLKTMPDEFERRVVGFFDREIH